MLLVQPVHCVAKTGSVSCAFWPSVFGLVRKRPFPEVLNGDRQRVRLRLRQSMGYQGQSGQGGLHSQSPGRVPVTPPTIPKKQLKVGRPTEACRDACWARRDPRQVYWSTERLVLPESVRGGYKGNGRGYLPFESVPPPYGPGSSKQARLASPLTSPYRSSSVCAANHVSQTRLLSGK